MDVYASSAAARRYSSQGSTAVSAVPSSSGKLKTGQMSNLSNLSNNSITKVFGAAKPRASSASITRRNNSKFDTPSGSLGGSGSFTVQQQQQQQVQQLRGSGAFNLDVDVASRPSNSSPVNGNSYTTMNNSNSHNSGGAFAGDAGRMDSYDQIRRNYEQSKLLGAGGLNGGIANSNALVSGNGAFSAQRAQSASGMRPAPQSSLAASSSNAYLAMRQSTQQAGAGGYSLPYPDGTAGNSPSASVGLSLLRGSNSTANSNLLNINNNSSSGAGNSAAVLTSKFGGTRGIANANASFNYGNTTAASLLNMSMNDFANGAFVPARVSSTELIPANYMPQPILCLKSNVTNQPKGVHKTEAASKQGKRVCFATPLTTSTPLLNPFMFQNIPAPSAAQASTQQGMQALQSALNSSAASASNGPVLGGGTGGGRFPVNASVSGAQGPQLGGLNRPASASAALMTTATTHFLNNVNNNTSGAGGAGGTSNVVHNAGGIVLTGAAAVVTSSNNSRANSPITVINPPQTNTFFNNSTPTSGANNSNSAPMSTNSAGIASNSNNNTTNQSKPPLFLSTLGSQNYDGGSSTGGVGSIVKPTPTLSLSKTDLIALYNVSETSTPVHNSSNVSPRGGPHDFPDAVMFPSIRSHTPSPVPTPNAHSNSSYVPLFSQSASPGKPLPKGMVLSNSMDNFASYGVSKDDHSSLSKSMPSVSSASAGAGAGAGAPATNKTNYNTSFASASAPGSSSAENAAQSGSQLRRKDSADSLISELSLTRAAPPSSGAPKVPSPKAAAAASVASAASSLAREDYDFSADNSGNSKSKKKAQRPSLAEQLAHIHVNAQGGAAKATDELDTPKTSTTTPSSTSSRGNGGQESFFSQSLNSAIAIGRSVVSGIGATRLSTGSPTADLLDIEDRSTQSSGSAANAPANVANALFSVPARLFSVGSCTCKNPGRVMFYSDRCEYPFHHPHDSNVVNMVIQYSEMSGVTTVGTKLRFKIPRRSAQGLGEIDVLNSLHLVTLELTSTASMTNVREKIVPLIAQSK